MTTVDSLIADYAQPIALGVDLDPTDYDQTAGGLEDAAADLEAVARLGDDGPKTQKLLRRIDGALYDAKSELEMD